MDKATSFESPIEGLRVLYIEDNLADLELVKGYLAIGKNSILIERIEEPAQLESALLQNWDAILADFSLPKFDAMSALKMVRAASHDIPFLVFSGTIGEKNAIALMKSGASDIISKSEIRTLLDCILREVKKSRARKAEKQAFQNLKKREAQISTILATTHDGVITVNDKGVILEFNAAAERMFQYSKVHIQGSNKALLKNLIPDLADTRHIKQNLQLETSGRKANGSSFPIESSIVYSENGGEKMLTCFVRDITARKNQEKALRESERALQEMANAMPQIVWTMNPNGEVTYINQGWILYSGTVASKDNRTKYIHPDDIEPWSKMRDRCLATGEEMSHEMRLRSSKGEYRWFLIRAVAARDEDGKIKRWYGASTDIHEQKSYAEELSAAKKAAEDANRSKTEFLANMSHEIRTPLGAILGFADLMSDPYQKFEDRLDCIETIRRNGALLSKVINDILDLSKVESHKLEIESLKVPLLDTINDVISLLSLKSQEKGIGIRTQFGDDLPYAIQTDPTRLRQILINVIGNAIKFTQKGFVSINVQHVPPTEDDQPGQICVQVTDTGPGISPSQAERLFNAFMQGDTSTTRKFGGTGLGLVLSRKLALALGGNLHLKESHVGVGSTFEILISTGFTQTTAAEFAHPKLLDLPKKGSLRPLTLHGRRILVVDDSQDNRVLISRFLTLAGAEVQLACDGQEGLQAALAQRFDSILMDIQMPNMDGFQAIAELRKNGYNGIVIALTAHAMKEDRQRCLDSGFDEHLSKPIERWNLIEVLQNMHQLNGLEGPKIF